MNLNREREDELTVQGEELSDQTLENRESYPLSQARRRELEI